MTHKKSKILLFWQHHLLFSLFICLFVWKKVGKHMQFVPQKRAPKFYLQRRFSFHQFLSDNSHHQNRWNGCRFVPCLVIQVVTFLGWWKRDPFKGLSDLQRFGDEKVTAWITWYTFSSLWYLWMVPMDLKPQMVSFAGSKYWWNQGFAAWFRARSTTLKHPEKTNPVPKTNGSPFENRPSHTISSV